MGHSRWIENNIEQYKNYIFGAVILTMNLLDILESCSRNIVLLEYVWLHSNGNLGGEGAMSIVKAFVNDNDIRGRCTSDEELNP